MYEDEDGDVYLGLVKLIFWNTPHHFGHLSALGVTPSSICLELLKLNFWHTPHHFGHLSDISFTSSRCVTDVTDVPKVMGRIPKNEFQ